MARGFRFRGGYPAGEKTVEELGPPPKAWLPKPKPQAVAHPVEEPRRRTTRRKAS